MTLNHDHEKNDLILLRGIHLHLTAAMITRTREKAARLLRHHRKILRIEIDVDIVSGALPRFAAKGRLIVPGPDVTATVETENAYKSLDLLIDKLDRMLRKRRIAVLRRRLKGDLRRFIPVVTNATTAAARPC